MFMKNPRQRSSSFAKQGGFALIGVLLLMILISAVAVAFLYATTNETKIGGSDREDTLAYYGAEAAMEKMMVDVGLVYTAHKVPQNTDFGAVPGTCPIAGVACIIPDTTKYPQPVIAGLTYPTYAISFPNGVDPISHLLVPGGTDTVQSGSFQGLSAQTIPLTLTVVSQRTGGAQVSMVRNVQVALIPVFQFGVFSETDLSYFPGPNFDFAGRVHTNGSLYLAAGSNTTLSFHDKITVVNNVVHSQLANGINVTTTRTGLVLIPGKDSGCDDGNMPPHEDVTNGYCRDLNLSGAGGKVEESANSLWPSISTGAIGAPPSGGFAHFIQAKDKTGLGGSKPLSLPFVQANVGPIEIIRRGVTGDSQDVADSRLYNQAQIRVLLDDVDSVAGPNFGKCKLPNDKQTVQLTDGVLPGGVATVITAAGVKTDDGLGSSVTTRFGIADASKDSNFLPGAAHPINPGCLRVEYRTSAGLYVGVTQEWLHLGFARGPNGTNGGPPDSEHGVKNIVNPKAILILQRNSALPTVSPSPTPTPTPVPYNYYPINLYDSREGERDPGSVTGSNMSVGGIMNLVELDVGNLSLWLQGSTPTDIGALGSNDFGTGTTPAKSGPTVEKTTQNGYILYFSDRRGMALNTVTWAGAIPPCTVAHPAADTTLSGDYGYEDVVKGNGVLDTGEDSNGNCHLDVYGAANIGVGFGLGTINDPYQVVSVAQAKARSVSAARHALRLVNGTLGNVPTVSVGVGGFTVASENPVYIQGNYNAKDQGTCTGAACFDATGIHSHASVIADAVTLLSNAWDDDVGFANPSNSGNRNAPVESYYRLAIAGGKSLTFPNPIPTVEEDYGTDGGVHNFLRFLENWGTRVHYRGSLVSFYFSHQASGTFKSSGEVYGAPTRDFTFDVDFKDPTKMPPGTPRFQDIVNVGYQQDFTPQ